MARDTAAIGPGITVGTATPDPETTVEALLRLHNRFPLDSSLSVGDRMKWDGTDWVADSATYLPSWPPVAGGYRTIEGSSTATNTPSEGQLRLGAFLVPQDATVDRIGIEVTSAATAGGVARLGIYDTGSDGLPDALVLDAGTVDVTTTGVKEITISQALTDGLYWLGSAPQGAPSTAATLRTVLGLSARLYAPTAQGGVLNSSAVGFLVTGVTGALPANVTPSPTEAYVPGVFMRSA